MTTACFFDLAVTTDFRDVLATLLESHVGLEASKLNLVFPSYTPSQKIAML
jgi:uncharacterized protein (DUF1501 family)